MQKQTSDEKKENMLDIPVNIQLLSAVYDCAAEELYTAISKKKVSLTDERIRGKVRWVGEVAQVLSIVYQLELMRRPTKEGAPGRLPAAQKAVDHALIEANKNKFPGPGIGLPSSSLGSFHSPGGWTP